MVAARQAIGHRAKWNPVLRAIAVAECRADDADDDEWPIVEPDRPANHRRVAAISPAPQVMTKDDDLRCADIFLWLEGPSQDRCCAEQAEKAGRDDPSLDLLW